MGGGGSSGPTLQQQQLQTQQALTNAQLNTQENDQRKVILNAMQGSRVFRGSALSRSVSGNSNEGNAGANAGAPSAAQINSYGQITTTPSKSLLDQVNAGPAGGVPGAFAAAGAAHAGTGTRVGGGPGR